MWKIEPTVNMLLQQTAENVDCRQSRQSDPYVSFLQRQATQNIRILCTRDGLYEKQDIERGTMQVRLIFGFAFDALELFLLSLTMTLYRDFIEIDHDIQITIEKESLYYFLFLFSE